MKKVILFLVLLIVVVGAAVGTLYFLKLGPFEETKVVEKTAEELEFEKEDSFSSIPIKPFTIPMFQGERIAGSIQVQFELEVPKGQEEAVNSQMVRLEDAYLRDLYVFMPRLLRNKEKLDIIALKRRLMRVTEKIIGPDVVDDILIQSVADTPG